VIIKMTDEHTWSPKGWPVMACPTCGDEYTHLRTVKQYETDGEPGRLSVVLRFYCEQANHDFFYTFRQYKGTTQIEGIDS
jgi:hypothetical protein